MRKRKRGVRKCREFAETDCERTRQIYRPSSRPMLTLVKVRQNSVYNIPLLQYHTSRQAIIGELSGLERRR